MNKIALVLLTAMSTLYVSNVCAESEGGPDMFRTIEHFEDNKIKNQNGISRRAPILSDDGIPYACVPGRPCADTAALYKEPKFHGEPVVSEDDY